MDDVAPAIAPAPSEPAPARLGGRRVALVHDWLTGMRGGERALEALVELVPDARIFTLLHTRGSVSAALESRVAGSSFVGVLPWARRRYRRYLPLFPMAIEQLDLDPFDLVISTSHCAAKAVVTPGRARHLCYCFTPMRYAWDQFDAYFGPARVGRLRSRLYSVALRRMARWDAATSGRVHRYVAISQHVAGRIRRYYNRAATVIYPPVDTEFFRPNGLPPGPYFLIVSALVPYKRVDLAIDACAAAGVPLRIVGDGPERERLRAMSGPSVEFLGVRSDEDVRTLYQSAAALLLPGEEDFGIAPVEAQACGRPVVALARGGACETVRHGTSGWLVDKMTPDAFATAIRRVTEQPLASETIRADALHFSKGRYQDSMRACLEEFVSARGAARW
jgi:glycosyltransferase involved in cell wall biosynthesis